MELVSILIITRNRTEELIETVLKLTQQDYLNIEILVADNNSEQKITQDQFHPINNIRIVSLDKNYGISAFDYLLKIASGTYILILDDDSYPEKGAILKAVSLLKLNPECGVVAFNIYNSKFNFYETKDLQKGYTHLFVGCGALFKKKVIDKVGFYDNDFFIYVNEIDLSIRILESGFKIYYLPEAKVIHRSSGKITNEKLNNPFTSVIRYFYLSSNYGFFLVKHFSIKWANIYLIKWFLNRLIVALIFNYKVVLIKSILRFYSMLLSMLKKRKVVSTEVQKLYKFGNFPLVDRDFFPSFEKSKIFPYNFKKND